MASAVENALGALDVEAVLAQAGNAVVTKHVTNLAREALSDALTPERFTMLPDARPRLWSTHSSPQPWRKPRTATSTRSTGRWTSGCADTGGSPNRRRVSAKGSGTGRWKAEWWNTDEAVQRLETLWRGWEAARLDPGLGTSAWWINHAAPHMAALLAVDGPFADSKDENPVGDALPYQRPPDHLFPPDKQPG